MIEKYEDFCKDSECIIYNNLSKLKSIDEPSGLVKMQIKILEIQCRQNCEYTADEFSEWIKEKQFQK